MSKKLLAGIVAIVVVALGATALVLSKQTNDEASVTSEAATPVATPSGSAAPTAGEVAVRLTSAGFEPKQITVKVGQTVAFTTDIKARISSDPHPVHTSNQELNLPATQAGETVRITPTKVGTFGIHNHLDESQTMTMVVQQ